MPDDPIKHVVVLMLENRSFDQMLGALKSVSHLGDLNGVDPQNLFSNKVKGEEPYYQAKTRTRRICPDPKHELKNVLLQIDKLSEYRPPRVIGCWRWAWEWSVVGCRLLWAWIREWMRTFARKLRRVLEPPAPPYEGRFVEDYAKAYPRSTSRAQRQEIMSYYPLDFLPALHALAREFTICDRWHSSVPGPTWANRFFVHSGTALGRVWMPEKFKDVFKMQNRPYKQETLYDRLTEKKKKWRIYFGDIPQTFVMLKQLYPESIWNYVAMNRFDEDARDESKFPDYCFIEPSYFLANANDDHPPHNTMQAQCLIADVYNAIRSNKKLWESTLLVILYDEHGGFFDHVEPPEALAPDDNSDEYSFTRYGVRVPALLVSPWVKKGICKQLLDHASLLKYLTEKWGLNSLGRRVDEANIFSDAFDCKSPARLHVLPKIEDSPEMAAARSEPATPEKLTGLQIALIVLVVYLARKLDGSGPTTTVPVESPDMVRKAIETVQLLIRQQRQKVSRQPDED